MSFIVCKVCNEKNNPQFKLCWKCSTVLEGSLFGKETKSFEEKWTQRMKTKFKLAALVWLVTDVFICLFGWSMSGHDQQAIPQLFLTFFIIAVPSIIVFLFFLFANETPSTGRG